MNLIATSVKRPIAVAMACMVILLTGLFSVSRLPLEITPEVDFPQISIQTSWPDTSPEIIEAFVTSPIEAVANTVTNVQEVSSVSEEGQSRITVKFTRGTNMDFTALELSEKLSVIREELPEGTSMPRIVKYVPREFQTGRFFSIRMTGPYPLPELRRMGKETVKPLLLSIKNVADVEVVGGRDREIQILIDKEKMNAYGVSLSQITRTLQSMNHQQNVGVLMDGNRQLSLFVDTPLTSIREMESAVLIHRNGSFIRIEDIARVQDTYGRPQNISRINGNPAVVLEIEKESGSNTIQVADRIYEKLEELRKKLPRELTLIIDEDASSEIRDKLSSLGQRALFSILVIFLVLMLFMKTVRAPLIILSTIFFSTLFTFNLFLLLKISLNLVTLAGLALGFGMLVDNAIVVVENITRHRQLYGSVSGSAISGTSEVVLPIIASTLTTVAAFLPFLYMTGELRLYYLPFTLAVGLSLLSSLGVAFTLTPSLTAKLSAGSHWESQTRTFVKPLEWFHTVLGVILGHRGLTLFTALLILAASTVLFDKYVTKGRIWGGWGGREYLSVYLSMPKGSEIQRTDEIIRRFEMKAVGDPNVQKVSTNVYNERATVRIDFPRPVRRTAYPYILKEKLINEASLIAGLYVGVSGFGDSFSSGGFGRSGGGQRIKVLGYNYRRVGEIAEDLGRRLERNARVRDVNTNASNWWYGGDVFEVILRIDRERLGRFGMTPSDLLYLLQSHLTEKLSSSRVKLDGRLIENSIKFQGFSTFSMEDLKNLLIQTPSGETVRLREVSVIEKQPTMPSIIRENQQYKRLVQYEYRGPWKMADRLKENIIKTTHLPPGYKVESDTYDFMSEEETSQIYFILAISLFLIFLVTAGLFESLIHPFLILFTVPLSLSGVFLIFFLTGTNFDRSAYIGVILLGGIVVNDSILLVDHINLLRRKGVAIREAVIRGASERMRPILMTTFTTIGGLLPLVFLSKDSGDIWYSLALATIGGLMASTVLALTVIPAMYMTFEKIACSIRNGLQTPPSRQADIRPGGRRARNPA